jgi:hypothetical protein
VIWTGQTLLYKYGGAWTGRAAGCALGKPTEIMGITGQPGGPRRSQTKSYLQARDQWPLQNLFSGEAFDNCNLSICFPDSWRENIAYMEPDADIHSALIAGLLLETVGAGFRPSGYEHGRVCRENIESAPENYLRHCLKIRNARMNGC